MRLEEYIAGFMRKSKFTQALFSALEDMLADMRSDSRKTEKNTFLISADEHLNLHEKDVGLAFTDDSDEVRKARVISRLRGWNITTVSELKSLIKAYGFECTEIEEHYSEYRISIKTNAPKNEIFYDMCEAIEEVKPAHIAVSDFGIESAPHENMIIHAMPELCHSVVTISSDLVR